MPMPALSSGTFGISRKQYACEIFEEKDVKINNNGLGLNFSVFPVLF